MPLDSGGLYQRDAAVNLLPIEPQSQGLPLLGFQLNGSNGSTAGPNKTTAVEPTGTQPQAKAIVDQHLHACSPSVGKHVGHMDLGLAKYLNHSGHQTVHATAHIQWLHRQLPLVHLQQSRHINRARMVGTGCLRSNYKKALLFTLHENPESHG